MRPTEAFLRLVLGLGQIGLAAATLVAWLLGAPLLVVLLLALATGGWSYVV